MSGSDACREVIFDGKSVWPHPGYNHPVVQPEERHRLCWYGRRTPQLPEDPGSHTIVDGELCYCAHPMYWPVVRYEFDLSNCEDCDVFKPKRNSPLPDK